MIILRQKVRIQLRNIVSNLNLKSQKSGFNNLSRKLLETSAKRLLKILQNSQTNTTNTCWLIKGNIKPFPYMDIKSFFFFVGVNEWQVQEFYFHSHWILWIVVFFFGISMHKSEKNQWNYQHFKQKYVK